MKKAEEIIKNITLEQKEAQENVPVRVLPFPCVLEVRFTRMERAAVVYERISRNEGQVAYSEDAHILTSTVKSADELRMVL